MKPCVDTASAFAVSLVMIVGCGAGEDARVDPVATEDAAIADGGGGVVDGGASDVATVRDAQANDANVDDASSNDASSNDASAVDAHAADASPSDASASDAAAMDAGGSPTCASIDGTHDVAMMKMAANVTGDGRSLATLLSTTATPGVTVAYRGADGMVHTAVFGNAHNASFDPNAPPLGPTTLFQAGSVSKPISALAYLMSAYADATLPVDIRPTVANIVAPPYAVTPRMLLTHTAGASVHGFGGYAPGLALPTVDQIVEGAPPANSVAVAFANPGPWSYSGGGIMVWNAWLNRQSGTSLPALVHDALFVPSGATRSSYLHPLPASEHDAACGYDTTHLPAGVCRNAYPEDAAAGLWTTPKDLTCMAGYVATQRPDALARVTSSSVVIAGYPQTQGLALRHRPANGVDETQGHFFEHSGVNYGFCTQLLFFSDGRAIATMDDSCQGLSYSVARGLCRELNWSCAGVNLAAH